MPDARKRKIHEASSSFPPIISRFSTFCSFRPRPLATPTSRTCKSRFGTDWFNSKTLSRCSIPLRGWRCQLGTRTFRDKARRRTIHVLRVLPFYCFPSNLCSFHPEIFNYSVFGTFILFYIYRAGILEVFFTPTLCTSSSLLPLI